MALFRFSQDIPNGHNTPPWYVATEFGKFYATCWYSFEALTDSLIAAVCGRRKTAVLGRFLSNKSPLPRQARDEYKERC